MPICKLCCYLFSLLAFALYGFEVKHVVFPHPSEVPDELKIEPDDKITVAPDGTYLVNGKPRYIIQVKLAETPPKTDMIIPTPGYPASLKWLYQTPIDFNIMQRIGFDMIGCASKEWEIVTYNVKEEGISLELSSKELQAGASLLFYSNANIEEVKTRFLEELQSRVSSKITKYIGDAEINKWKGFRYISVSENSVLAHLTVIVPCGSNRVLIADMSVPVGSMHAKVSWNRLQTTWIQSYNRWVKILSQRR